MFSQRMIILAILPLFVQITFSQPVLKKQGTATQLIVDGRPFLILGGELNNSTPSSLTYMEPVWQSMVDLNVNTVLAGLSWELIEPEEGRFDFTLVDGLIEGARRNDLRLIFLWFSNWKNGMSSYVSLRVKKIINVSLAFRFRSARKSTSIRACLGFMLTRYVWNTF